MEPNEPQAGLYDFLYKDSSRIASYYAQLFSGRLTSLEESDQIQDTAERDSRLSVKVAESAWKDVRQNQTATKRVIDPHDVVTTDVLSYLVGNQRISSDYYDASSGDMVLIKGTIVFIDQLMLECAMVGYDLEVEQYKRLPKKDIDQTVLRNMEAVKRVLDKFKLPSAFLLHSGNADLIGGIIKDVGMEESIPTYYIKHGTNGLSDVYLVAIKEVSTPAFTLPADQMFGVAQQIAQALCTLVFPADAQMVTPVAIFRKL